jgi:hypothetical protein
MDSQLAWNESVLIGKLPQGLFMDPEITRCGFHAEKALVRDLNQGHRFSNHQQVSEFFVSARSPAF